MCAKGVDTTKHQCFKNYDGSSAGMESDMAVRGVEFLAETYDIHCDCIIADGDSSMFKKLRDNVDWTITKKECVNHLIKN